MFGKFPSIRLHHGRRSLIFYTLKGPACTLEIHDDHIRLIKKSWFKLFTGKETVYQWPIQTLSQFQISVPQYIWVGKLEWQSFDGVKGSFRFSTNAAMVKKIETYLQKCIIKNHQKVMFLNSGFEVGHTKTKKHYKEAQKAA